LDYRAPEQKKGFHKIYSQENEGELQSLIINWRSFFDECQNGLIKSEYA